MLCAHFSDSLFLICRVFAVIITFNSLENCLHLLRLALPLLLTHLGLPSEEFLIGLAVATTQAVPQGGKLTVIIVEVKMMHSVAGGSIHHWAVGDILPIVNENGPEVDKDKQEDIGQFLQRKDERKDVVWYALGPAVQWVEGMGGKRTRHDPLVMWFVQSLVDERVVQTTVNPVDEEISKTDKERKLQNAVVRERLFGKAIVEFGVASDFENEEGSGQKCHWRHGTHRLLDFQRDLVFQKLGVLVGRFVPNIYVR